MFAGKSRNESGATAVLVAILAVVLLMAGAFAIDLGQVYAKRSALQSAVDLAVLAAAAELDGSDTCTTAAKAAAERKLSENWIDATGDPMPAVGFDTGDADRHSFDADGFMQCTGWEVYLEAPTATVDFGLARILSQDGGGDVDSVEVPASAMAGIFSPDTGTMPAYAVSGCDYGPQTLLDDSPGAGTPPPAPTLPGGDTDTANPALKIDTLAPSVIAKDEITGLTIDGNQLSGVTRIQFATPVSGSNLSVYVDHTTKTNTTVTLNSIPASVTGVEGIWWVRVSRNPAGTADATRTWSNALQLQVGNATLECASSVTDGNFGSLLLYRNPDSSTNERLALNMAIGLDFDLTTFPNPHADWECTDGVDGAVASFKNDLQDGTNCVASDTGLPALATEMGLITGVNGEPGSLAAAPTSPGCGSDATIDFGGSTGSVTINNDYLTCFFTNGATTISDIGSGYAGGPVISEAIFDSPRFYWVPVLGKQTSSGGSDHYQIVDFRPAFITDQPPSATSTNPQVGAGGTNNGIGLTALGGGKFTLRSVKVVFFDVDALPDSVAVTHPTTIYRGVGPKIISLVE